MALAGFKGSFLATLLLAFSALIQTGAGQRSCQILTFNPMCFMSEVTQCLSHTPDLLNSVIMKQFGGFKNPDATNYDICGNTRPVATAVNCLLVKLGEHLPAEMQVDLLTIQPSVQQWVDVMNQVCAQMEELNSGCLISEMDTAAKCFTDNYFDNLRGMVNNAFNQIEEDPLDSLCRHVNGFTSCFSQHPGTCSAGVVEMVFKVVNILFPYCEKVKAPGGARIPGFQLVGKKGEL